MARADGRDDLTVWDVGVGRIRREAYVLRVGDESFDVDELRSYFLAGKLEPALRKLDPPPTAAECLWLARYAAGGTGYVFDKVTDLLMELVNAHVATQGSAGPPAGGGRRGDLPE